MQKKLKKSDWPVIYQHVRPRLEHERKKKFKKPTVLLINGTKKSWDKIWREFRRTHALDQGPRQGWCNDWPFRSMLHWRLIRVDKGTLPPLPGSVVIRTPSPDPIEISMRHQQKAYSCSHILQLFQTTLVSFQPLFGFDSQWKIETRDAFKLPDKVYRLSLQGIPFARILEKVSSVYMISTQSDGRDLC